MAELFLPFDLDVASRGVDVDDLPFGVIVVDRSGIILEYNAYESEMAGLSRERVVGRSFFRDVAPCTAIRDFEGRFDTFLASEDTSIEPFQFVFPFRSGPQRVVVLFVRLNADSDRASICVIRRPADPEPA